MSNRLWTLLIVLLLVGTAAVAGTAAQQAAERSWSGPAELGQWHRTGRDRSETSRTPDGVVIYLKPDDRPNTLRSPRIRVPKRLVTALEIRYRADIVTWGRPVMRIGWLDDKLNEDEVKKCVLTVQLETGRVAVVTIPVESFRCWAPDGELSELAFNIDQPDLNAVGSLRLLSVQLR
jgi:hypothetical protein